jgi:multimeric flavodoxin WrbA
VKILALIGSPRKKSNTDSLVDEFLRGSAGRGYGHEKIYLYARKIRPCVDCRGCKKGAFVCRLADDMREIYPKLEEAEVLLFGTPNYWYGPTAQMKLLFDRLRPYVASGRLAGKRAVLIIPAAEGAPACRPMLEMFRRSLAYLKMTLAGSLAVTAYERGEVLERPADLARARELGASLTGEVLLDVPESKP